MRNYDGALWDLNAGDLGVLSRFAEVELYRGGESVGFFNRIGQERRIVQQQCKLFWVRQKLHDCIANEIGRGLIPGHHDGDCHRHGLDRAQRLIVYGADHGADQVTLWICPSFVNQRHEERTELLHRIQHQQLTLEGSLYVPGPGRSKSVRPDFYLAVETSIDTQYVADHLD